MHGTFLASSEDLCKPTRQRNLCKNCQAMIEKLLNDPQSMWEAPKCEHPVTKNPRQVSILYWPGGMLACGHLEFAVANRCFNAMVGPACETARCLKCRIEKIGKRPFLFQKIDLKLSGQSRRRLVRAIPYEKGLHGSCSLVTFRILSSAGVYSVPFPLSYAPSLSVVYLRLRQALGDSRIKNLQLHQSRQWNWRALQYTTAAIGLCFETLQILFVSVISAAFSYLAFRICQKSAFAP